MAEKQDMTRAAFQTDNWITTLLPECRAAASSCLHYRGHCSCVCYNVNNRTKKSSNNGVWLSFIQGWILLEVCFWRLHLSWATALALGLQDWTDILEVRSLKLSSFLQTISKSDQLKQVLLSCPFYPAFLFLSIRETNYHYNLQSR